MPFSVDYKKCQKTLQFYANLLAHVIILPTQIDHRTLMEENSTMLALFAVTWSGLCGTLGMEAAVSIVCRASLTSSERRVRLGTGTVAATSEPSAQPGAGEMADRSAYSLYSSPLSALPAQHAMGGKGGWARPCLVRLIMAGTPAEPEGRGSPRLGRLAMAGAPYAARKGMELRVLREGSSPLPALSHMAARVQQER